MTKGEAKGDLFANGGAARIRIEPSCSNYRLGILDEKKNGQQRTRKPEKT